ncbi:MFS transporter [Ktedonosporobacter rubrisoli]|uniref:MFS transporter n=1 Tax=Ktedonosporobacter rubrisoli TaxID=2509675 RepID=A0A4P6JK17_KTERU|nr:MFS transporter [Ktedonosporobacter rubrisoli]QBD75300.1 MFS transporter [Ktedonosporobacter rubrisoli]
MKEPRLVLALLPALLWNLGIYIVYTYVALLLQHNLNITDVSLFLLIFGLGPMLGNWICGVVIDRIGSTRPIFFFLVAVLVLEPLLMLTTHSMIGAFVTLFVWGLSYQCSSRHSNIVCCNWHPSIQM